MTIDLPFVLKSLVCRVIGHDWREDKDVQYSSDDGDTWHQAHYCARCFKTCNHPKEDPRSWEARQYLDGAAKMIRQKESW